MGDTHSKAEGEERAREEVEALLAQTKLRGEVKDKIRAIANNTGGDKVSFWRDRLGVSGAKALAEALKDNTCLRVLNLWDNVIGNEGTVALAKMLKHNTTLTSLDLKSSRIGPVGAVALAKMLKHNTTMATLILDNNDIGSEGAVALAKMLKHNTTMATLILKSSRIGPVGAVALAKTLQHNTTITSLELYNNNIGNKGAVALAKMLKHNTTMTTLNVSHNHITEPGMVNVLKQLQGMDAQAKIRLFEFKLESSTSVARTLATLRTKRPDINVVFSKWYFETEDEFDSSAKAAYQDQLDLLKLLETGSVPLETAKVFVCGDYGIGKTTMIKSLDSDDHEPQSQAEQPPNDPDRPDERTPGIRVCDMKLQDTTSQGNEGGNAASLRVYDFGGQLAYNAIHTLMMSDRFAAFVVCVDLSQPEQHVKDRASYWLQFICTRLKQGIAAATATAGVDAMEEVKPRVVIVGTKRDIARKIGLVGAHWQPTWSTAMIAYLQHTFGHIIDIQDSLISLNCHQGGDAGFDQLQAHLVQHWRWLKSLEMLVPKVVGIVGPSIESARQQHPSWTVSELLEYIRRSSSDEFAPTSALDEGVFHRILRYLHSRGDLLWYSNTPSLANHVFVSPNWLLHDVMGKALQPEGVACGGLRPENGVVTFSDIEASFRGIASADLVINVLQHALLCFELPPADDGQRRFMLPSRVERLVGVGDAWPHDEWPLYAGRRMVRDGVQCLGLLRGGREVDVWVRALAGAECNAWSCMTQVFDLLQEEAHGIDHVILVLSANHLKQHKQYPAGYDITSLHNKRASDIVTSTHHRPGCSVMERVGDLLVHNPVLTAPWHQSGHEWHHAAWRLDDSFDRQLQWTGPGNHDVYSAPLPADTDLYRWIENQMGLGLTLSRVEVTKSTTMLRAFKAQVERSATRRGSANPSNPFNKDFGAGDPDKRAMLDRLKTQFAETPGDVNHVSVLIGFHGCAEDVADNITATGTTNLSSPEDPGFFGAGIYLTPQANYAAGYSTRLLTGHWRAPNTDGEHLMLLCAVSVGLAYPVTRRADYTGKMPPLWDATNNMLIPTCDFFGKPLHRGCDTHYAQVTKSMHYQATPTPGTLGFEEYVVSQEAQVLPFAKVFVNVDMNAYLSHLSTLP
ncbi:hypothetical protein PTSG_09099 [Salpingoeca rosetta]|uniref:Uncharacterized protein n=1 Tax=Salpingoeca rosetta (strain ATCC 50818 / BSB-021) TaxID=946362 RepID=F2UMQ4_SALR5|nr:uncharacterized protein PTSG_09099 [Salpingoeca rosetta]EGD78403.1 hypothetical protein PTSG_09099 [Salpingoeca rosetta]|eukprot:XP_004989352.1 hypothetical protein PTSG_09099 [Salpingoeca rosetta]